MKATPIVLKQSMQGKTQLNLSPSEHYEMHRLAYIPLSFKEGKEGGISNEKT
jgi:hypothetical protein